MKLSDIKTDSILVVLVLAVLVGGFWMNGKALSQKTSAIEAKVQSVEMAVKQLAEVVRRSRPPIPAKPAAPAAPAEEPPAEGAAGQ